MADFKDSKTLENLRAAFARESSAHRRYLYFARMAEIEGFVDIAKLFRELAESLVGHADGHMDFLKIAGDPITGEPIGDTEDNLAASLAGERDNVARYYPDMAEVARDEGFDQVASWFMTLVTAKRAHATRLRTGLQGLDD
jgi:rubrerythrin